MFIDDVAVSGWLLCVNCHICSCYGKQICLFIVDLLLCESIK